MKLEGHPRGSAASGVLMSLPANSHLGISIEDHLLSSTASGQWTITPAKLKLVLDLVAHWRSSSRVDKKCYNLGIAGASEEKLIKWSK